MLKITIELLPGGDETKSRVLGEATIVNDETGTLTRGNYKALFMTYLNPEQTKSWQDVVLVNGFVRQVRSCWDLLYEALRVLKK